MSQQPDRGIQLKEGSFTFPPNLKCRVDTKAIEELPKKFEVCRQGIEVLGDLFYEAPPEKKEGVLVQKAIWENMLGCLLETKVFNASSTYTTLSNQLLPVRVSLPKNRQYFPVNSALGKDPSNPFRETKKFARELLDIVAAIKTLREESLFAYANFHIYPNRDAFVITDSETGGRHLAVGMHSMIPPDIDESVSSEECSVRAIKDLVQERWDKREFRKILKASNLNTMFEALKHLARDIPTLELVATKTAYASVYTLIGFIVFSILMFLTGVSFNQPVLEEIQLVQEKRPVEGRIVLQVEKEKEESYQVIGTYRAKYRLETMGGLGIFNLLGLSEQLDRLYSLNYQQALKRQDFKFEPEVKNLELVEQEKHVFHFKGLSRWGRERFKIVPSQTTSAAKRPIFEVEALVLQPDWILKSQPKELVLESSSATLMADGRELAVQKEIRIYATPPQTKDKQAGKDAEVAQSTYFSVSFKDQGIPLEIHYLKDPDPKSRPVATIVFKEFDSQEVVDDQGKKSKVYLPRTIEMRGVRISTKTKTAAAQPAVEEEGEGESEEGEETVSIKKMAGKLPEAAKDGFNLPLQAPFQIKNFAFHRLLQLPPQITTVQIVVPSKHLPSDQTVNGHLHLAVPGVLQPLSVPITFIPKETITFVPKEMRDERDRVTGLAFPIYLQKAVWTGKDDKMPFHELAHYTFHIEGTNPHLEGFGALGLGVQIDDPRTLYFYNTATGETKAIEDFTGIKEGKMYFAPETKTYKPVKTECFEPLDRQNLTSFTIRKSVAEATRALYAVVLTDKNVENTSLIVKRGGEVVATLPVTARSKEALRMVKWKEETTTKGLARYGREDWCDKVEIEGPLGAFAYQTIIFSGEQADKDISDQVYCRIKDPQLVNCIYQTVDNDWFGYLANANAPVRELKPQTEQLTLLKRDSDVYFRAEQPLIGKVQKYLLVPGPGVKAGDGKRETEITFFYPAKGEVAGATTIKVAVSCAAEKKVGWDVNFDEEKKQFVIRVDNYPKNQAAKLAKKLQFLSTCASVTLLHRKADSELGNHIDDRRWTEMLRWSLQSVGFKTPQTPPSILGKQGEKWAKTIRSDNDAEMQEVYQSMREALFLGWSPQTQALIAHHLGLNNLEGNLERCESTQSKVFELKVQPEPQRANPILVSEPERFAQVTLTIPYDKLLLDKQAAQLHQLHESYYYGISKNLNAAPEVTVLLRELYPATTSLPRQTNMVAGGISISDVLYYNLLRDSLWEERLKVFHKPESKFWIAMLSLTPQIADVNGKKIDEMEVNKIAAQIQAQLTTYFLTPVELRRVFWKELKSKVRGKELDKNRDTIGTEEAGGLLRFVERSLMPQFSDEKGKECWYANFSFIMDQPTRDQCPLARWGDYRWLYLKTYLPGIDGGPGGYAKLPLFRRDGMSLVPYGGTDYSVTITKEESEFTHIVTVKGITAFQDWFVYHPADDAKATKAQDRLRLKVYYEDAGVEKELIRPGEGGPPIVDFEAHPLSVILFEVSGYHISPDRVRQLVRNKSFTILTQKGTGEWQWTFNFENGPILAPFAYSIDASAKIIKRVQHTLSWRQLPPPDEKQRTLDAFMQNYRSEFLYLDRTAQLPSHIFSPYPYTTLKEMYDDYKVEKDPKRVLEILGKLFDAQLPEIVKFTWNKDLTDYYKDEHDSNQMFRYNYADGHQWTVTVAEIFSQPVDFKGAIHPKLILSGNKDEMTLIWRLLPIKGEQVTDKPPKYILEKKNFPTAEPVFSKE